MTAGLGFPAYAGPPETVQISPRFKCLHQLWRR
jgi:hypothetical protein